MLLAYAFSTDARIDEATRVAFMTTASRLVGEFLPTILDLGWDLQGAPESGTFLRAHRHLMSRELALRFIRFLQALSRQFPAIRMYVSGWGSLPMTQIVEGRFEMFQQTYEEALGELDVVKSRLVAAAS